MQVSRRQTFDNYGTLSQTNGQVERYNKTVVTRLRQYVAGHQCNCDTFVRPLKYAYNTDIYCSTNTTSFSLVLSRNAPRPTLFSVKRVPHTGISRETNFQVARLTLQETIKALCARPGRNARGSEKRYKRHHHNLGRPVQIFKPADMVFVDRPPLSAPATTSAHAMTKTTKNKIPHRALGPFCVISVQMHTITIEEDSVPNTICIDRGTLPPSTPLAVAQHHMNNTDKHQQELLSSEVSRRSTTRRGDQIPEHAHPMRNRTPDCIDHEYTVDQTVQHTGTHDHIRYVIQWYGYSAENDTM